MAVPAKVSLARFATTDRALAQGLVYVLVMTVVASVSSPEAVLEHVPVLGLVLAAAVLEVFPAVAALALKLVMVLVLSSVVLDTLPTVAAMAIELVS